MEEVWKDIPDYEGFYQASNLGRVRSLDRVVKCKNGMNMFKKGKVLKPHISQHCGKDRYQVQLIKDSVSYSPPLARCIWAAFNGPIPEGYQVNHINEDTTDNRLENLNLMTAKENTNWGTGIERRAKKMSVVFKGKLTYSKNPNAKPILQYSLSGEFIRKWDCAKEAIEYYNLCQSSLSIHLQGKTSRCGGYKWKFA